MDVENKKTDVNLALDFSKIKFGDSQIVRLYLICTCTYRFPFRLYLNILKKKGLKNRESTQLKEIRISIMLFERTLFVPPNITFQIVHTSKKPEV